MTRTRIRLSPLPVPVSITPSSTNPRQPFKEVLETIGKLLLGAAGLCYVTGLIVVSLHLGRYGLNSLVLSQLHYVMAGIWALLPIVLALFLAAAVLTSAIDEIERTKLASNSNRGRLARVFSKRNRKVTSAVFGALSGFSFLLWFLLGYAGIKVGASDPLILLAGAVVAFAALGTGYGLSQPGSFRDWRSLALTITGTSVSILLFLGYLILFAKFSYQHVPWSTGGGGSSQVQIVVSADAKPFLESVGVKFPVGQNRTDSLRLLLVTDKEYVIINPDGTAISVPADSVRSVLYEK